MFGKNLENIEDLVSILIDGLEKEWEPEKIMDPKDVKKIEAIKKEVCVFPRPIRLPDLMQKIKTGGKNDAVNIRTGSKIIEKDAGRLNFHGENGRTVKNVPCSDGRKRRGCPSGIRFRKISERNRKG